MRDVPYSHALLPDPGWLPATQQNTTSAYNGSIIQDLGYYPHAGKFLSDLARYVRSGDLIEALLRDSQDINEHARRRRDRRDRE